MTWRRSASTRRASEWGGMWLLLFAQGSVGREEVNGGPRQCLRCRLIEDAGGVEGGGIVVNSC
jgi:hypothetical protein